MNLTSQQLATALVFEDFAAKTRMDFKYVSFNKELSFLGTSIRWQFNNKCGRVVKDSEDGNGIAAIG